MAIERAEVRRIAELARLELTDEQVEHAAAELSAVLEFVGALRRLDLTGCEPTTFAPPEAALREDQPDGRRLANDAALAMAPEREDGFFLVPPIVEYLEP
jgi:aspartyl-tRNA(Asn)/glutamyl-tRNA(Gln) amidotransferase subunit C